MPTQTLTPIDPDYVTSKFAQNQGQSLFNLAGRGAVQPSEIGDPAASSYLGTTSPYYINNGKIVTEIARHAVRSHRLQAGRQILRRAQQRVRLRQLRDHPRGEGAEPAGPGKLAALRRLRCRFGDHRHLLGRGG